jgi:hypothetical protein
MTGDADPTDAPLLRVVAGGQPAPDELAALVVAVAAVTAEAERAADADAAGRRRGGWADRSHGLRRPLRAGLGAWRASRY